MDAYQPSIRLVYRDGTFLTMKLPSHFILTQLHTNKNTFLISVRFIPWPRRHEVEFPPIINVQIIVDDVTDFPHQYLPFELLELHQGGVIQELFE